MKTIILLLVMAATAHATECIDKVKSQYKVVECTDGTYAVLKYIWQDGYVYIAPCGKPLHIAQEIKKSEISEKIYASCPIEPKQPIVEVE